MGFWTLVGVAFVVFVVFSIVVAAAEKKKVAAMSPSEKKTYVATKKAKEAKRQGALLTQQHGQINPSLVCPHCQEKGNIRTQPVKRKKGISGGKAAAAILTGGVSMLATGLSRKERSTAAYCGNCESEWDF
jgi:hypothetical protein